MTFRFNTTKGVILCTARLINTPNAIFTNMAVDTGASITMIPKEHTRAINLPLEKPVRTIAIATANGEIKVPIITIPVFECLGVRINKLDVICHNLPTGSPAEGLLGINFLAKAKTIIDFANNTISTS